IALLLSLAVLPIVPSASWQPNTTTEPAWRIFSLLAATMGVPFLLLSATSSLLQVWYARARQHSQPYRLYALSNGASLLALLSYPLVVEPNVATHRQALLWSAGYSGFVVLCAWLAL